MTTDPAKAPATDPAKARASVTASVTDPNTRATSEIELDLTGGAGLVLYDGQCGLCNRSVRWLIEHDRGRLRYAPLQGPTAAAARARFPEIPQTLESVVFIEGERAYLRTKAFLHVARHLTWPWRAGHAFRWLPAGLIDPLYRFVARNRYRWFGSYDECRLPTQAERHRMLP
jgi:predicted DCC family thiol-disulfide oxidoreductase YuxK